MLNQIISIVVLMLFVVVCFIGCGFIGSEEVSLPVVKVGLLYVSEDRPATVVIGVLGEHHNTGVDGGAKVSADRDGNTIHLSATMRVYSGAQGDAVSDVYGEVSVRNLEVGEYKVMYGGHEFLKFRIAADAGYVKSGPIVTRLEFTVKTVDGGIELVPRIIPNFYQTPEPVQVTMRVVGYFDSKCLPYLKTHIERSDRFTSEDGTPLYDIYVDISGEVPIVNTECALKIHPYDVDENPSSSVVIDLGTFPLGEHDIEVNDSNPNVSQTITIGPEPYR